MPNLPEADMTTTTTVWEEGEQIKRLYPLIHGEEPPDFVGWPTIYYKEDYIRHRAKCYRELLRDGFLAGYRLYPQEN